MCLRLYIAPGRPQDVSAWHAPRHGDARAVPKHLSHHTHDDQHQRPQGQASWEVGPDSVGQVLYIYIYIYI